MEIGTWESRERLRRCDKVSCRLRSFAQDDNGSRSAGKIARRSLWFGLEGDADGAAADVEFGAVLEDGGADAFLLEEGAVGGVEVF